MSINAYTQAASGTKTPKYIMHVVKFSETLTKIAKNYDVTVNEILNVNPSLSAGVLKPEQIIRIPNKQGKKIPTTTKTTENSIKQKPTVVTTTAKQHTIQTGQTMYAISKMYNVSVEDIQKWNNLNNYILKIGDVIYVSNPNESKSKESIKEIPKEIEKEKTSMPIKNTISETIKEPTIKQTNDENTTIVTIPPTEELAVNNETQKELIVKYKNAVTNSKSITVKGTGAPMTTSLGAMESVFFAMHKTLPIGTVIKIKNLVNNKIVYAKVIGKLPETDENKHVIIRYSAGVKNNLQLQNGKCYVQIDYPE